MTSIQSTLGEGDEDIAEELAKGQREISIAEFFEKNKHMLGFDSGARGLVTAVKEAVDNALDATEEAEILPDIYVEIREVDDYLQLVVEDNGPGITKEQVPKVFGKLLYGSRFHAREQSRGQQGIGISAAVLYSQLTSGKPARITSRTQGRPEAQYFELIIDTDTNEPEIKASRETSWDRSHGTRIELEMEANMRARTQLHDYIRHTAVVNPHARLELREPGLDEPMKFERATDQLPDPTEEIRPHPHGVELGTLRKMLAATESYSVSGFLQGEFTRVGQKTATKVIDNFRDRHFGRELSWTPPTEAAALHDRIEAAVSNKGAAATADFADRLVEAFATRERVSHHDVRAVVDSCADAVEADTGTRFGGTVRGNTVEAVWAAVTGLDSAADDADADADTEDADDTDDADDYGRLADELYALVDEATSTRKDEATKRGLADRLARNVVGLDDGRHRLTEAALTKLVDGAADDTVEYDDATVGGTWSRPSGAGPGRSPTTPRRSARSSTTATPHGRCWRRCARRTSSPRRRRVCRPSRRTSSRRASARCSTPTSTRRRPATPRSTPATRSSSRPASPTAGNSPPRGAPTSSGSPTASPSSTSRAPAPSPVS
jgi:DNA topoisomerase-6 subunit B